MTGTERRRSLAAVLRRPMVIAVLAAALVVAAVVTVLVVASGPSSPGEVTFAAAGREATTGPSQWCDVGVTECEDDPGTLARLAVPPGTPLTVTVPEDVLSTPWQVVFSVRDAAGAEQRGRSEVRPPGSPATYTLTLPSAGMTLDSVEVQQYGARMADGPEGPGFVTRSTWVLGVD